MSIGSLSTIAITSTTSGELQKFAIATATGATTLQNRDTVSVHFELTSGAKELNNWVGVYCVTTNATSLQAVVAVDDYIAYRYTHNKTSGALAHLWSDDQHALRVAFSVCNASQRRARDFRAAAYDGPWGCRAIADPLGGHHRLDRNACGLN